MKAKKTALLTFAERCKNIIASNWIGSLNTIKADGKGSKENIHTSKVMYMLRKGKPYIWVPEKDLHNVNTIIDERGSLAVTSSFPGPLAYLFRLLEKLPFSWKELNEWEDRKVGRRKDFLLPPRVALTGDVVPLKNEKAHNAVEKLREAILSEQKAIEDFSSTVSNVLRSSSLQCTSRSEHLNELLEGNEKHVIYKFDVRSSMFIDCNGGMHEVDAEDFGTSKADILAPFSAALVDGINQSDARRRALMLFCLVYFNENAKDACMLSVDRKGFDLLGKIPNPVKNGFSQYQWKEFRFTLKKEVASIEAFFHQLMEMEEKVVKRVSGYSGLG